jgi:hypothetical protein
MTQNYIYGADLGSTIVIASPDGDWFHWNESTVMDGIKVLNPMQLERWFAGLPNQNISIAYEMPIMRGNKGSMMAIYQGQFLMATHRMGISTAKTSANEVRKTYGIKVAGLGRCLTKKTIVDAAYPWMKPEDQEIADVFRSWCNDRESPPKEVPARFKLTTDIADAILTARWWKNVCADAVAA